MKLDERQKKLDEEKWLKSEKEGRDVCGEFDYCKCCDKNLANPCANAFDKNAKKATKKPAKKVETKKACAKAPVKKVEAKKPETKKAPAKKTAKK